MFVEDLCENNPEQFKAIVKKVLEMDSAMDLRLAEINDGYVCFDILSPFSKEVNKLYAEDFAITGAYYWEEANFRYRQVMSQICGKGYVAAFQKFRNEERKEMLEQFDEETSRALASMTKAIKQSKPVIYLNPDDAAPSDDIIKK